MVRRQRDHHGRKGRTIDTYPAKTSAKAGLAKREDKGAVGGFLAMFGLVLYAKIVIQNSTE